MMKKMMVAKPENRIDTLGSKPIRIGASAVEPNMATTCCRPAMRVWPVGRRSSGMMAPSVFRVQCGKKLIDHLPQRCHGAGVAGHGNAVARSMATPAKDLLTGQNALGPPNAKQMRGRHA